MDPPQLVECTCGHMGSKHRDDGSCAKCACAKFKHPVHRHSPDPAGIHLSRKASRSRRRAVWSPPTRDSR